MSNTLYYLRMIGRKLPKPIKNTILAIMGAKNGLNSSLFLQRKWYLLRKIDEKRRLSIAMRYIMPNLVLAKKWAKQEKEESNFYYTLTALNKEQLAHLLAVVTETTHQQNMIYIEEIENDVALRQHLTSALQTSGYGKDIKVEFGRRIGWYAMARILKPKVIVETGVDHGVGACVLASALAKNAEEGYIGRYYGTDLNPSAGRLFCGEYSKYGTIIYGDSIESLKKFDHEIDLFINDSDHSEEYEFREYETIKDKITEKSVILGDNSHSTNKLSKFSVENGRSFVFFSEKPLDHWYPGAGIGYLTSQSSKYL